MLFKNVKITKREIIVLSSLFICILVIPFIVFSFWTKDSFSNTGIVGDTIGGMTAPFLSFLGSVLVYFALKSQIDANKLISDQFKEQNQDQLFFRLIDNLHARINNYSTLNPDKNEIRSYETLKYIVEYNHRKMDDEAVDYGRHLLAKEPETINHKFYVDILSIQQGIGVLAFEKADELKNTLIDLEPNDRWEYIKRYLGGRNYEKVEHRKILRSIGSVHFYKTPFNDRQNMYANVYHEATNTFGGFLDGYFSVLEYLLDTISKIKENDFYMNYLKNQFTRYEKILIFYYIASGKSSDFFKLYVIQNGFLTDLHKYSIDLIDLPSQAELDNEISQIQTWSEIYL